MTTSSQNSQSVANNSNGSTIQQHILQQQQIQQQQMHLQQQHIQHLQQQQVKNLLFFHKKRFFFLSTNISINLKKACFDLLHIVMNEEKVLAKEREKSVDVNNIVY